MMENLLALKKEIFKDGKLHDDEIKKLRHAIFDAEGMTMEKGNFLFDLKNTISSEHQTDEFKDLFIESITALLLEDEDTPGEIDESEAKWLRAKIQSKGYHDKLDTKLLDSLKQKSINFPEILHYKGKVTRTLEHALYFSRYLTTFAVVASILSSIILFVKGTMIAFETIWDFALETTHNISEYENLIIGFISSVDIYLFAMVLIIFGMGIYELFINKIDPVEKNADERPSWLKVSSIDDLKSSLGKVILMVLIVNFFKYTIHVKFESAVDLLFLSIGIVLVSIALYVAHKSH